MSRVEPGRRDVFLEIAPLLEHEWTGIPLVTAKLAWFALGDTRRRWHFLVNNQVVGHDLVREVLRAKSGRWVEPRLLEILRDCPLPSFEAMRRSVAIFPNVKVGRRMFGLEALVVHDLSTVLVPHYHHPDTVAHHAHRLLGDIESTDAFFCVSQATADDLRAYFQVPDGKLAVVPLGVRWDLRTRLGAAEFLAGVDLPRFVLVLGTVEPRKNIGLVLDFIARNPAVLEDCSFVFVGRDGWLNERVRLERKLAEAGVGNDRVIFSGFVSEVMKLALLCRAAFTIYPSMFEGFGLPVLESVSVGCPVLCSWSSSLPEVVDETCILFDPTDPNAFSAAFADMDQLSRIASPRAVDPLSFEPEERFGWDRFHRPIEAWLDGLDRDPGGPASSEPPGPSRAAEASLRDPEAGAIVDLAVDADPPWRLSGRALVAEPGRFAHLAGQVDGGGPAVFAIADRFDRDAFERREGFGWNGFSIDLRARWPELRGRTLRFTCMTSRETLFEYDVPDLDAPPPEARPGTSGLRGFVFDARGPRAG